MTPRIPLVDISAARDGDARTRRKVAREIDTACRDLGFLMIDGHGVDSALLDRLHEAAAAFFTLPAEAKRRVAVGKSSPYTGYAGFATENLSATLSNDARGRAVAQKRHPDLRETFQMGPFDFPPDAYHTDPRAARFFAANLWPREVPELEPAMTGYFRALESLASRLMRLYALALGMPETWFDDKIDRHISSVLVNHYPGLDGPAEDGQLRSSPHTDFGATTILHLGPNPDGLQVLDRDGTWHDVTAPPGVFVVNLGDMMARWTNDAWTSTMHRVVVPTDPEAAKRARQTVTFFLRPNYDASISCIETCAGPDRPARYPPITSGEHYESKIAMMRKPTLRPDATGSRQDTPTTRRAGP